MNPQFEKPTISCQFLEHYDGFDLYFCSGILPELIAVSKNETLKGFEKGLSGECRILAYTLGLAKKENLFADIREKEFLINTAIGFLVQGYTGEHDDKKTWPVFFTLNRLRAEQFMLRVNEQAKLWEENRESKYLGPPYGWSLLDPNMQMDYTGTKYSLIPIKHESDPDAVSYSLELCSECNSQVYDTVNGRICERGHTL